MTTGYLRCVAPSSKLKTIAYMAADYWKSVTPCSKSFFIDPKMAMGYLSWVAPSSKLVLVAYMDVG